MNSHPDFDIDHVARLARIELTAEERAAFSAQLGDVLGHIALLQEADVTGVEATAHAFPMDNVWAADLASPGLSAEDALRNAPAQRDGMFVVPKVVE
jgi:aspartyl-tRNA(Asn)/glutamyl-tRNA(Gln) amidotransferase subunit C